MLVGGRLISSAGKTITAAANKVLPKAIQVGAGIGAQTGAAALEGAGFTLADIAAHKAIDTVAGRETPEQSLGDIARQVAVGAATFGAGRAAHIGGEKLMAPKAAVTPPPAGATPPTTPPATPPVGTTAAAENLIAKGVPASVAKRMVEKQNAPATTPSATTPAGPTTEQTMVAKWPDAMLSATLDLQQAKAKPNLALIDAIKDEVQKRAEAQPKAEGTENVGPAEPQTSGESNGVVSEPSSVEPARGPEAPAADGVVPAEPNVSVPDGGEIPAPAPIETPESITPPVTEGTPANGTEAPETEQTKAQEQEAPAAGTADVVPPPPTPPKVTKPRAGGGDRHTITQNADGKWEHAINGDIVNAYDTKRQAQAASLLTKAQKNGDADLIAQRQKAYDEAMSPAGRGRPLKVIPLAEENKPATEETTPPVEETKTEPTTEETTEPATEAKTAAENLANEEARKQLEEYERQQEEKTTAPTEKTPITVVETKTTRSDVLTGPSTKVKLSDGSEHEINRQDTNTTAGLPGWHDVNKSVTEHSFLGNTKAEAIQELIRRQEQKTTEPPKEEKVARKDRENLSELESALETYNNPDTSESGIRAAAKYIEDVANDKKVSKAVRSRANEMLNDQVAEEHLPKSASATTISRGPADKAFSKFTTAAQAVSHITRTGSVFQKALAKRILGVLGGVKFVVVEKGQELPPEVANDAYAKEKWNMASAMFHKTSNTILVRGDSFGRRHSLNNTPVLHEALHAATAKKIDSAFQSIRNGKNLNSPLVKAVLSLQETMYHARELYNDKWGEELLNGVQTAEQDHLDHLNENGKAFTDLHEFLAYGMTDEDMQIHLLDSKGVEKGASLFSKFVDSIRKMFNMGKDDVNGLSDLILGTDRILKARDYGDKVDYTGALATAAKDKEREINKATEKVKTSRAGNQLGQATADLSKYRDPRYLWGEIKGMWGAASADLRSRISHMYTSDALAYGGPGDTITGLKDAHEAIQKMAGSKQAYMRGTADVADKLVDFFRASPELRDKFEDILNESTLARYDPSNPSSASKGLKPELKAKLDADFTALGENGKQLYRDVRDYYKTMNDVKQHLLEENLSKLQLEPEARDKLLATIRKMFEGDKIEPYFPLSRFGDYVLKIGEGDGAPTYRFDTRMQRDRAAREHAANEGTTVEELKGQGEITLTDNDSKGLRSTIEGTSKILKAAYEAIDSANLNEAGAKQELKDGLYQAYLAAMPENSVRKMFIHRKGTPGFSSDILRAVNDTGLKVANSFAKLEHAADIRNAIELSRRQLKGNEELTPFVKRMEEIAGESLSPKEKTDAEKWMNSTANLVTKLSFIRNLTSFSSALMQPMDVVLKGVPILTGNHGAKAIPELLKMTNLMKQYGSWETTADGTKRWRAPSIEFAKGLTDVERQAVRDMVDVYGVTKDTLTHEIFNKARTPSTKVGSKGGDMFWSSVDNLVLGGLMHHGERLSREVMALTSFRLHLAEMNKADPSNPANYHEAVKMAVRETNEALGNYNADNKPLIMRGAAGKLLGMYKFFPLLTTKVLVGNFFRMLPGLNKAGKAQAATKFFGVLGTHALFGGVVALPAFSLAMKAYGAAWNQWIKDPDAPEDMRSKDPELWFRTECLPSFFNNPDMKRIAEYGLINYITGSDVSSRASLNDMWYRDPQPGKTLKDNFLNWGQVLGGPAVSTALNAAQGVQLMSQGDYERGLEKLTPGSISKLMMAYRYATQGVQTAQGIQLVEPGKMPINELVGQAIGYAPAQVTEAQDIAFKANAAEKGVVQERGGLMNQLKDAYRKSVDPTMTASQSERYNKIFDQLLEKREQFNVNNPENEITAKEILSGIETTQKNIAQTEAGSGVKIDKKNARLVGSASDAAAEALEKYR
jgi:hypothetical protein